MAAENAAETLAALKPNGRTIPTARSRRWPSSRLPQPARPPNRIECYDISNTQGTTAVGSMVVFEQGAPKKATTAASTSAR